MAEPNLNPPGGDTLFDIIALDADDTLWDNESFYIEAKEDFVGVLQIYEPDPNQVKARLEEIEEANVAIYGYGIKSFLLSMIEAALDISDGLISSEDLETVIDLGRYMLSSPVQVFPHTEEVLAALAQRWKLMLITKGDVFEQSQKIERTGLAKYFCMIEIVGLKTPEVYAGLLQRHNIAPQRFLMVGNSLRSDIQPVLALGGQAVYIPYINTWAHEHRVDGELSKEGYYELESLAELPELLERISML
jgi:putative hydrolase of the HAD superfamily